MPLPLEPEPLVERLRNYPRDNYLFFGSVIKGVALGVATPVGLAILRDAHCYWPRIAPWIASFVALCLTHVTWGRGVLLTNSRANMYDITIPLALGVFEFGLFGILTPFESNPQSKAWHYWLLILCLHSFCGFLIVTNRRTNTCVARDFDQALQQLGHEYKEWMRRDQWGAGLAAVVSLTLWLFVRFVLWNWAHLDVLETVLATVAAIVLCKPAYEADQQRHAIDRFVSTLQMQRQRP